MTNIVKIELEAGKYTYEEHNGTQRALRYGETWRDLTGDKFVGAMAAEIERLRGLDADRCRVTNSYIVDNARLAEQLTASQSREEKLREAVRRALTDDEPYIIACREALALPHDNSALSTRLAQERERLLLSISQSLGWPVEEIKRRELIIRKLRRYIMESPVVIVSDKDIETARARKEAILEETKSE